MTIGDVQKLHGHPFCRVRVCGRKQRMKGIVLVRLAVIGVVGNCPVRIRRSDGISGEDHPHQDYREIRINVHSTQHVHRCTVYSEKGYESCSGDTPTVALHAALLCRSSCCRSDCRDCVSVPLIIPAHSGLSLWQSLFRVKNPPPYSAAILCGCPDASALMLLKNVCASIRIRLPKTQRGHPQWMASLRR